MSAKISAPGAEYEQFCRDLDAPLVQAVELCSLPHSLDDTLGYKIIHEFANFNGMARIIWAELKQLPFIYPSEGDQWRFAQQARAHFVAQIEKQEDVYLELNRYLTVYFSAERSQVQQASSPRARELDWQIAYHLAPIAPEEAVERLLHFGEEAVRTNRLADVKSVVDIFEEQTRWLSTYQVERAYFEGRYAYAKHNFKVAENRFTLVWQQSPTNIIKVVAGHLLAVIWAKRSERRWLTRAEAILRESLELGIRLSARHQQAMVLNTLGGVLVDLGGQERLEEAEQLYRRSLELRRSLADRHGEAMVLNSLGGVLVRLGGQERLEEAEQLYRRSLKLERSLKTRRGEAMVLNSLGGVLVRLGGQNRLEEAEQLYRRSLELLSNLGDRHGNAMVLNSLGGVLVRLGGQERLQEAEQLYRRSLEIGQSLGVQHHQAMVLNSLGGVLVDLGGEARMQEAEQVYRRSLELKRSLGDRRGEAMALHGLANWAEATGNFVLAYECVEKMMAIDESLGNQRFANKSRERLAGLRRNLLADRQSAVDPQTPRQPSFAEREELATALLALPSIYDRTRRRYLLSYLPSEIAATISHQNVGREHTLSLVNTSLNYENGMEELLKVLRSMEGVSIPMQALEATVKRILG